MNICCVLAVFFGFLTMMFSFGLPSKDQRKIAGVLPTSLLLKPRYVKAFEWGGLSYVSEELACHAIETYTERLAQPGENEKLKVHCYRAVLEHLLVTTRSPKYRHTILKTVPRAHTLSFPVYVGRATQKLVAEAGLEPFTEEELTCPEVKKRLAR